MGDIPSSNAGPTLGSVPILAAPDPSAYSPAPALAALQTAFQQGVINTDDIVELAQKSYVNKAQRQQLAQQIQASQLAMGNAPAAAALTADQIQSARSVLPVFTAQDIAQAKLGTATAGEGLKVLPYQTSAGIAGLKAQQLTSQFQQIVTSGEIPPAQWAAQVKASDPSGYGSFLQNFFQTNAPWMLKDLKNPDGSFNAPAASQQLGLEGGSSQPAPAPAVSQSQVNDLNAGRGPTAASVSPEPATTSRVSMGGQVPPAISFLKVLGPSVYNSKLQTYEADKWNSEAGKALAAKAESKYPDMMQDANGFRLPYEAIQANIANAPTRLDDAGVLAARDENNNMQVMASKLTELRDIVNTNPTAFGPNATQGSWTGQLLAKAAAWANLGSKDWTDQRKVKQAFSEQVGKLMSGEGGIKNIRNLSEFAAVTGAIPTVEDNPDIWNTWFGHVSDAMRQHSETVRSQMKPADARLTPIVSLPLFSGAPKAGAPAATSAILKVMSQTDYDALPSGKNTPYVDPQGVSRIKP
jgi:hypothetical protein